jgi:membrane fusion protein, multidrug efflux system
VIAVLCNIANLQVTAKIPERDVAVLRSGLAAEVTLEAYPGVVFGATVFRVSPLVDPISRTKEIYLAFDRDDPRVNAGMFARVKLYTTVSRDCVTVPEDAIVTLYDKDYVYAINADGTVSRREVAKGVTVDGACQILSGLAGGESVALEGVAVLSDGVKVKIVGAQGGDK